MSRIRNTAWQACTGTLINDRDSPAREIQNIAKKRAMERRERERLREQSKPRKKEFSLLPPIFADISPNM
jgi:hypothetical protein